MNAKLAGRVNAHTHVYSALVPFGLPAPAVPPANFVEILQRVWWRLDRALDARAIAAGVRLYAAEALLHGTTTLVDHHESPNAIEGSLDVIADACEEIGIRAVLCYGATERNGGRDEARRGLAECARFARENRRALVRPLVGLHASFTVSDDTLREAGELCATLGVPCHVHVAEDVADVEDARRRGATGPLERLLAAGTLPRGSVLAHGVHLDEAQVRLAESRGLWLVQNPRSNEGNAVGYPQALRESERVALGTDGYPADMRAELEALVRLAAEHEPETPPAWLARRLDAGRALATERFGAEAIARDTIEHTNGTAAAAASRAGAMPAAPPRRVAVNGRVVVEHGRLVTADLDEIRARAREEAPRLWARLEGLRS